MTKALPQVYVVLVNWNHPKDTLECISSLKESIYPNLKIIVVDNGSTDDSAVLLSKYEKEIILLKNADNLGFTGGNNVGMRYALTHQADYVFLLNNDTVVAKNCISELIQAAESHIEVGVVSPKILLYDHPEVIWFAGDTFNKYFLRKSTGHGDNIREFSQQREIAFSTGCAMLIKRNVLEDVGLLCEDYFAVAEDWDYCLRVAEKGYKILYAPQALVWHKVSASSGGHDAPRYVYYQTRNALLLRLRWSDTMVRLLISVLLIFFYFLKRILKFVFHRNWRGVCAVFFGVWDAFTGQMGCRERQILLKSK
jgi:hypothetical protein